jgi:hypothetical protein
MNILPIYVFDGKPPDLKARVIQNRRHVKQRAFTKLEEELTKEEQIKYFKRTVTITKTQIDECKELLNNGANKIFICGYSLGGAMSTVCTFDFHANLNKLNITANNINSVHIANPPIGNRDFVNLYNKYVINTVRLVHLNDPIPRMTDWLYAHTKNEYLVVSNKYTYSAHMLSTYDDCIIYNRNLYSYISKELLIYTMIIAVVTYYIRKYYTRDIVGTRHF